MNGLTRRAFLGGLAACPALHALEAFARESGDASFHEVDPRYYEKLPAQGVQCRVCPLNCTLSPGQTCFCRTRRNHDGRLLSHAYGNPCILTVDPIEKAPLSHFLPGESTLSLAVGGCNLRCLYCQNWKEAQAKPDELRNLDVPVEKAVDGAVARKTRVIAFTYTEPVAYYEYMRDIAVLARSKGVRSVVATAGYINPEPLRELCRTVDAFSVSLKGFDERFYEKVLGSELAPVLRALEVIREEGKWLEIVTLVVPTYNDDPARTREMVAWVRKHLGAEVPIHFGRFVPEYRLKDLPRTPVTTLETFRKLALDAGLKHAYVFNVSPHEGNHTYCGSCGKTVVERLGFKITASRLEKGACGHCRAKLPGVWS